MNYRYYIVAYRCTTNPQLITSFLGFDRYRIEAISAREAIKIAKERYKKEFDVGIRNVPPIKQVKFSIVA